ncbi:hypothetical protein PGTUg99_034066 [Puccinia graminis f. sp. tritici]|uniref:Uncharacterized protein n=1 Tax=Puccinia graminis f. sp. tritici TaxID=56615 RepID=A0A5B0QVT7_PUCGR|nr:hypothetical protein PGTUg99_034066 [Puccinia graminis f. sp. tritici]
MNYRGRNALYYQSTVVVAKIEQLLRCFLCLDGVGTHGSSPSVCLSLKPDVDSGSFKSQLPSSPSAPAGFLPSPPAPDHSNIYHTPASYIFNIHYYNHNNNNRYILTSSQPRQTTPSGSAIDGHLVSRQCLRFVSSRCPSNPTSSIYLRLELAFQPVRQASSPSGLQSPRQNRASSFPRASLREL